MAKKKVAEESEDPVVINIDPCWHRYPDKALSFCTVTIDIGGSGWAANAEFTEKEERETKDLAALKRDRLHKAFLSIQINAMDFFNG